MCELSAAVHAAALEREPNVQHYLQQLPIRMIRQIAQRLSVPTGDASGRHPKPRLIRLIVDDVAERTAEGQRQLW